MSLWLIQIQPTMEEQMVMEPPLYFAEDHVWNVCFHPSADVLACSQITGQVEILKYNSEEVTPLIQNRDLHKSSVRYCTFNPTGNLLASCGEDRRLAFMDGSGKIAHIIKKAHPSPIYRCQFINDHIVVSGDDDGLVKVWDLRTAVPVFEASDQTEQITGLTFSSESEIYTSCINGTVAGYDLRHTSDSFSKLIMLSDSVDQELSGIQLMKNGKYLVCPSSEGSLIVFKREQLEHNADRIQGHPGSIETIVKVDENTLISGSEDGFVRGVGLYPSKILQVLGQHEEEAHFPIQSLSLSHCKRFLASSSHDNSINFYDVSSFLRRRMNTTPEQAAHHESLGASIDAQDSQQSEMWESNSRPGLPDEEFSQQSQDSDSSEEEEEEEEEMDQKRGRKKGKNKKMSIKARQKQIKKDNARSFFKGI